MVTSLQKILQYIFIMTKSCPETSLSKYDCYGGGTVFHCLVSNREGLGTSSLTMGLATIDPHSHKVLTKLYKIPKFGVNRPKSKQDTAI